MATKRVTLSTSAVSEASNNVRQDAPPGDERSTGTASTDVVLRGKGNQERSRNGTLEHRSRRNMGTAADSPRP